MLSACLQSIMELQTVEPVEPVNDDDGYDEWIEAVLAFAGALDAMRLVLLTRPPQTHSEAEINLFQQSVATYSGILVTMMIGPFDSPELGPSPFRDCIVDLTQDLGDEDDLAGDDLTDDGEDASAG
jgi:hypothetical protein